MNGTRVCLLLTCLCAIFFLTAPAWGTNHALIIGVGAYPHLPSKDRLEGPSHDVRALTETLTTFCDFAPENITRLVDSQATHKAILKALGGMKNKTRPGDFIFIYFSGHGTSWNDNDTAILNMDANTGALVPVDFSLNAPLEDMREKLIIGKRDLFPIIQDLEQGRNVLTIFDACYSGQTVRSCFPSRVARGKTRHLTLPANNEKMVDDYDDDDDEPPSSYGEDTIKRPSYPYNNTVYISAAGDYEEAMDIDTQTIQAGFTTVDGHPHGALTNALLHALQGTAGADIDGNGSLTYMELKNSVSTAVSRDFKHTPCMLYPENWQDIPKRVAFRIPPSSPPEDISASIHTTLGVKLEGAARKLKPEIEALPNIKTVTGDYDVLVTPARATTAGGQDLFHFYLPNQTLLATIPAREVPQWLSRQVRVRELTGLNYPPAGFHVFTEVLGGGGVLLEGSSMGFRMQNDGDSWLLLINIDSTGIINVLYPAFPNEIPMVPAGKGVNMPDMAKVIPPNFGTEYLKAFAFKKPPTDLTYFMGAAFTPDDPKFNRFMEMVSKPGPAAQMTISVKTAARGDVISGGN